MDILPKIQHKKVHITESPRDAWQGLKKIIPVKIKVAYINILMNAGFDVIDFGSFVSDSAIPQLADTAAVLSEMELSQNGSQLMVLTGNTKGAQKAGGFKDISIISFPFSFSKTFLKLNINSDIEKALLSIGQIQEICLKNNKKLRVYLAMAFGNPYGDKSNPDLVMKWMEKLLSMGIDCIYLSDIIGVGSAEMISEIYTNISHDFPKLEYGFHLHTEAGTYYSKIDAAYKNGCRYFDTVINGMGGCPMSKYEMLGNLDTSSFLDYLEKNAIESKINSSVLKEAIAMSKKIAMDQLSS